MFEEFNEQAATVEQFCDVRYGFWRFDGEFEIWRGDCCPPLPCLVLMRTIERRIDFYAIHPCGIALKVGSDGFEMLGQGGGNIPARRPDVERPHA